VTSGTASLNGFILSNGAHVWGLEVDVPGFEGGLDGFYIDYNGHQGPNTQGADIIYMLRCASATVLLEPCNSRLSGNPQTGAVGADFTRPNSINMWNELQGI
jgi:hypothetical protein